MPGRIDDHVYETFAAMIVGGMDADKAYAELHPNCSPATARTAGSRWRYHPTVVAYLGKFREDVSEKAKITLDDITSRLNEIALRCMAAVPVRDKDGEPTGEWKFDAPNAIKANTELARLLGFEPAKQLDVTSNGKPLAPAYQMLASMTQEEIAELCTNN